MKKIKKTPKKAPKKVVSKTVKRIKKAVEPILEELKAGDIVFDKELNKTFQANQSIEHKVSTDPNRYELA